MVLVLALILSGCNLPAVFPTDGTVGAPTVGSTSTSSSTLTGGMQVQFVNLADGSSEYATLDANGRPLVMVQLDVTGKAPAFVTMTANGFPTIDAGGRTLQALNGSGALPFTGEIPRSPKNGGGEYSLVISAVDNDKQNAQVTVHITVTGVPVFTLTPPPLDMAGAQERISGLILQEFGVSIPKPSVYRFDDPQRQSLLRWIGSAYNNGTRHYIDLFDDTHFAWSIGDYTDPAYRASGDNVVYCRPSGIFRVLTVFVEYGNIGANRDETLAKVQAVVSWLNELYADFATSQGLSAPLMRVEADAAYLSPPPV